MTINLGQRRFAWRTAAVGALLIALIAGLVGWLQPHPAQAVTSDAIVSIDFTPSGNDHNTVDPTITDTLTSVEEGDLVPVDIVIQDAVDITSFNFGIEFDNTIFSVDTASFRAISDSGTFFFLTAGSSFGSPVNAVSQFPAVIETSGDLSVVTLTGATLPLVKVAATEGLLARITFKAMNKTSGPSTIRLVVQPVTGDFLSDGSNSTPTPTLNDGTVTVVSQTTPPIAVADTVVAKQAVAGQATTITAIDLLTNDTAGSSGVKANATIEDVVSTGTQGTVTRTDNNTTVQYVSPADFEGTTTFTYKIKTDDGTSTNAALVTITIDGTAPVLTVPAAITVVQDTVLDTGAGIPNGASMSVQAFGGRELNGQTLAAFIGAGSASDGNGSGVDTAGVTVAFKDSSGGAVTATGGVFDIGATPVKTVITAEFSATDEAGNTGTATSTFTILPALGDEDGDQFNNDVEAFIGTDFLEPCRTSIDPQNLDLEADDRFPADTSGDGKVGLPDLGTFAAAFGSTDGQSNGYLRRVDFSKDGKIGLPDLGFFAASFNFVCDS